MGGFLKSAFGTMLGVELASYDMAYQAARTLDRNRRLVARRLRRVAPNSSEAAELAYHLQQINNELARFAYYGVVPRSGPSLFATFWFIFFLLLIALLVIN